MPDYGVKISKIGKSVDTSNVLDLTFASFSTFQTESTSNKIAKILSFDFTIEKTEAWPPPNNPKIIAHGLGYKPFFVGMFSTDGTNWLSMQDQNTTTMAIYTDGTNVKVYGYSYGTGTVTVRCKVCLYQDGV